MDKFKIGEIVLREAREWTPASELKEGEEQWKDFKMPCIILKYEDGQYYIEDLKEQKGWEYLGYQLNWEYPDNLEKLNGEIIKEKSLRGNYNEWAEIDPEYPKPTKEYLDKEIKWPLFEIKSMKEVPKYCKESSDKMKDFTHTNGIKGFFYDEKCSAGKCGCILPNVLVTFNDGKQILIFDYEAEFISELTGVRLATSTPTLTSFF